MRAHSIFTAVIAASALAVSQVAVAEPDAKLWNGTWHLDAAKSKFASPSKEASETRTYHYSGGKLTMKSSSKDPTGKAMNFSYSAAFDGKFYPMTGNPNADSISLTSVGPREIKATSRMKGKTTVQSTAKIAEDGKHLTLRRTILRIKGEPTDVLEFHR